VKYLGGIITMRYEGQEHSTPGSEREMLDRALVDSGKGLFDAFMVPDLTRWTRDNEKNKQSIRIFRMNKIRFFVGTMEFNLNKSHDRMMIGMTTEVGEGTAGYMAERSKECRHDLFSKGVPCVGQKPYGRKYDKKTGTWSIDEEKKEMIKIAVKKFLSKIGREKIGREKIAEEMGISPSTLYIIFKKFLGDTWTTKMGTMKIPPLIEDQKIIKAVHERLENNKTINHDPRGKHAYLLSSIIFCADCGLTLNGVPDQMNYGKTEAQYKYRYRHPKNKSIKRFCPNYKAWDIRAEDIEEAVIIQMLYLFGHREALEKSILRTVPNNEKLQELSATKARYNKEFDNIEKEIQTLIEKTVKGIFTDEEARPTMEKYRERKRFLKLEMDNLDTQIGQSPTKKELSALAKRVHQQAWKALYQNPAKMTWTQKRELLLKVFLGKHVSGDKPGIYVKKVDDVVHYSIKGLINQEIEGCLPMSDWEREELLDNPIKAKGNNITSKFNNY
jgi:DNA invertase Pin-like site-specific DNA recombinase